MPLGRTSSPVVPSRSRDRWRVLALVLGIAGSVGCQQKPPQAPPAAEKQARKDEPRRPSEPFHVAPPPEYGNKIVLAQTAKPTSAL